MHKKNKKNLELEKPVSKKPKTASKKKTKYFATRVDEKLIIKLKTHLAKKGITFQDFLESKILETLKK